MKQLLNELSYLVMANTANAFIFRCLVVCVVRFASVHSQRKSAFLINSSLGFFFLPDTKHTIRHCFSY